MNYLSQRFFLALVSLLGFCLILVGCAASDVSRDVAASVDMGINNAENMFDTAADGDFADAYGNSNQTTKGALLGGVAGGLTGALASGVGIFPGVLAGGLLGASYGNYIDSNTTLLDRLQNRGVNIIRLGDQVLIVIPSARLFEPMTATVKPQAYSTICLVSDYINAFPKMLVKVTAYTSVTTAKPDFILSRQQANAVSRYLVSCGVNARLLYAEGCGSQHLVVDSALDWDASDNYRIEIRFEKLYV